MVKKHTEELYNKGLIWPRKSQWCGPSPRARHPGVKWALESITTNKASGGDEIPVKLFQILEDDAVIVLHSLCQQIWKTQQWPRDWKRSVFILIPKKGDAKECSKWSKVKLLSRAWLFMIPWDFPGKNTGVGCHFLLQGIFPTQGLKPGLPHCRQMLYCLSRQGSPAQLCSSHTLVK